MIINSYMFGQSYDPDAQAFFTASGLTGATNLTAINNLVVALKGYGIWTKMKAIYPMIGGTAALHKWNLKDPRDLNAAFRLTFNGGWTHSSTGALPNGTNAFANTYLDSVTIGSTGSLSYYSRTNLLTAAINIDLGYLKTAPDSFSDLQIEGHVGYLFRYNNDGSSVTSSAITDSRGFFLGSRTTNNVSYRNGIQLNSYNIAYNQTGNIPFYIGSSNFNGTATYFANRECAFASLGTGLTGTEAANLYLAVQNYNTTLSRQV